ARTDALGGRCPHRRPRGREHEPPHRRSAHGGQPKGRARVFRVRSCLRSCPRTVPRSKKSVPSAISMTAPPSFDIVIPTIGRPCLGELLQALADQGVGAAGVRVFLVDDRVVDGTQRNGRDGSGSLGEAVPPAIAPIAVVVPSRGRGPAAARNAGWV